MARHFNLPNHSMQQMAVSGVSLHQGNTESSFFLVFFFVISVYLFCHLRGQGLLFFCTKSLAKEIMTEILALFSNDRGSIGVFFSFASSFLSLFLLYFSYVAVQQRDAVPVYTRNSTSSRRVVGSNPIWALDFLRVYVFPRIYIKYHVVVIIALLV